MKCKHRKRLRTALVIVPWKITSALVPLGILLPVWIQSAAHAQEDVIYTKPSNQGIGLKLPTGYQQYRKAKRNYLNNLQRNSTSKGRSSQRQSSRRSRPDQLLYRFRETLKAPLGLFLRGIEEIARAAFQTNELALQGTTWDSSKVNVKINSSSKSTNPVSVLQSATSKERDSSAAIRENKSAIQGSIESIHSDSQKVSHYDESLDPFTNDGARLLSASFRVLSNSVGLTADVIRISGETFAGAFGSSVKIIGSSFFSAAGTLDKLALIVDSKGDTQELGTENGARTRRPLTSEKIFERSVLLNGISSRYEPSLKYLPQSKKLGLLGNTRKVAGKSMRLVSSVVRGIGNSIVVAGAASESLTASTASVAEDTVRIIEEFAKSIADAFHVDENVEKMSIPPLNAMKDEKWETVENWRHLPPSPENRGSFVFYGTDDDESSHLELDSESSLHYLSSPSVKELLSTGESVFITLFRFICEKVLMEFHFATEATENVPALAPDLLGVLFICFISSVILLRKKQKPKESCDQPKPATIESQTNDGLSREKSLTTNIIKTDKMENRYEEMNYLRQDDRFTRFLYMVMYSILRLIKHTLFFPFYVASIIRKLVLNRYFALFMIHFLGGWLLSNSSQIRSLEIQRKSEVLGYRSAIESLTSSSHDDVAFNESATWLNIILAQLWRVPLHGRQIITEYPYFIKRTIPTTDHGHFLYDGLEPYVSSFIGSILKESWETPEQMPTEIAYVSLHSFTLGSHAPIIRGIEIQKLDEDLNSVHLRVASDLLLSDSSLIFDFRISSLDYALLPVTQIKISSIDVRLDLDVRLELMSRYPFISMAKVSIARLPIVSVQIVPLNEDSGLRGINLSSLPVISDWVQSTIRRCLLEYLWPHYIAFDIERKSSTPEQLDVTSKYQITHAPKIKILFLEPRSALYRISQPSSILEVWLEY